MHIHGDTINTFIREKWFCVLNPTGSTSSMEYRYWTHATVQAPGQLILLLFHPQVSGDCYHSHTSYNPQVTQPAPLHNDSLAQRSPLTNGIFSNTTFLAQHCAVE